MIKMSTNKRKKVMTVGMQEKRGHPKEGRKIEKK